MKPQKTLVVVVDRTDRALAISDCQSRLKSNPTKVTDIRHPPARVSPHPRESRFLTSFPRHHLLAYP